MRERLGWAILVALSSLIARAVAGAPRAESVGCIGLTVSDVGRSTSFYTRVLSFSKSFEAEQAGGVLDRLAGIPGARTRMARLQMGTECIELTEYLAPRGRPAPADGRSNDRWFQHVAIIVSDMDRAYAALRAAGVEHVSSAPQLLPDWNPNAGGIRAFYFRDPDRHVLEVLQFPTGKGEARWHRKEGLFLGIDHTAIVVGDTDVSLAFYRDALGLHVTGTSENWGPEQEQLNHVAGARLRITTLHGDRGPGVELLEYLAPRDGRPMPADERANDLIHWQTTVLVPDLEAALSSLRGQLISPGPVALSDKGLGFRHALLLRDPDGHVLLLAAR